MTYKTLADLIAAYASGALDREASPLYLDNDTADVDGDTGTVYEVHPARLLREALTLLGIPWEDV